MMKVCVFIALSFCCACNTGRKDSQTGTVGFELPVLVQKQLHDSTQQWEMESINDVYPKFIGQFKFSDTVFIDEKFERRKIDEKQYLWEHRVFEFDSLSADGLQVITDYENTIITEYYQGAKAGNSFFPVYVVNETKYPKLFIAKDNYVFAIQEAVDSSLYDRWFAIEGRGFDFCGNGYYRRRIMPGEFIMFLMPKYSGTETTYLRTRIQIGDHILISRPYKGTINRTQFEIPRDYVWENELKSGLNWMFYGAQKK